MAQIYKKEELEYINGYIAKGTDIIGIDDAVVVLLNKLDYDLQRKEFEDARKELVDISEFDSLEFERESEHAQLKPTIKANTPLLDKKVEEGIQFATELDILDTVKKADAYFESIIPVSEFVIEDYVVTCDHSHHRRFDLPYVGNPLELTRDKLTAMVLGLFDVES